MTLLTVFTASRSEYNGYCKNRNVNCTRCLFTTLLFDSEESSSEDETEEVIHNVVKKLKQKTAPIRVENFIERTIPGFTGAQFQSHFRINHNSFEILVRYLSPHLEKLEGSIGKSRINVERQLLAALWLLATPDSYRSVGLQFNMGKSSLFICFERFVNSLNIIAPQIICWPAREKRQVVKEEFQKYAEMTGVIGAIDGTYVKIKAPKDNPDVYINRKCFHAITLQAICTPSLEFTDCFTGYPSSVSDIRVFKNSDIYQEFREHNQQYFDEGEYIIADKAYPVLPYCIPPYIDRGQLQNIHRLFNTAQAKSRQVIERAFALLFGRFRRLRDLDMNHTNLIPSTIIACCVLHNICLLGADDFLQHYITEGQPLIINNDENERELQHILNNRELQNQGTVRRNELARNIYEQRRNV